MITTPTGDQESVLVREIIKLNKTLEKANSWWRALLRGMLYAMGSIIGVALIAFVSGFYLWRAVVGADFGTQIEKTVNSTIEKQIKAQVTNSVQSIKPSVAVDQNFINSFLKNQR